MPLKLIAPLSQEFTLDKSDARYGTDGTPTKVLIRQATTGDEARREKIFEEVNRVFSTENPEVSVSQKWTTADLHRLESYLTLTGCNLEDDTGKPLFKFKINDSGREIINMTQADFDKAWNSLPTDITAEIYECVVKVNVSWGTPPLPENSQKD